MKYIIDTDILKNVEWFNNLIAEKIKSQNYSYNPAKSRA